MGIRRPIELERVLVFHYESDKFFRYKFSGGWYSCHSDREALL